MRDDLVERLTRVLAQGLNRRGLASLGVAVTLMTRPAVGAKKKKKKTLCFQGQTVLATKKKYKKLLKQGATRGACAACTPTCLGKACAADDGCGGTCARCDARSFCDGGTCAPCAGHCRGEVCDGADLQTALNAGGPVQACPGRYTGTFSLGANVTFLGAGEGADPVSNTILDAQGQGRTLDVPTGVTAAMQDVRITGGDTNGNSGGGVRVNGALEMTRCTVHQNTSDGASGGGVGNFGTLTMTDCTVSKNHGGTGGGILHGGAATAPLTMTGCTVTENTSPNFGAGIHHASNQLMILNSCTVSANTSDAGPGGLILPTANQTAQITATAFTGNTGNGNGGAIWNSGTITFDAASSVTGNTAIGGVGAGIYNTGTVTLNGATVSGNTPATDQCFGC